MPRIRLPRREYDVIVYMDTTGEAVASNVFGREIARSTDHTAVIQAAVDNAPDRGAVFIDRGVYNMTYKRSIVWYDSYGNLQTSQPFRVAVEVSKSLVIHGAGAVLRLDNNQNAVILYAHDYSFLEIEGLVFDGNKANNAKLSVNPSPPPYWTPFDGYAMLLLGGCEPTATGTVCFRYNTRLRNLRFVNSPGWSLYIGNHTVKSTQKGVGSDWGLMASDIYDYGSVGGLMVDNCVKCLINNVKIYGTESFNGLWIIGQQDDPNNPATAWYLYNEINNIHIENTAGWGIYIYPNGYNVLNNVFIRNGRGIYNEGSANQFRNVTFAGFSDTRFTENPTVKSNESLVVCKKPCQFQNVVGDVVGSGDVVSFIFTCDSTDCQIQNVKIGGGGVCMLKPAGSAKISVINAWIGPIRMVLEDYSSGSDVYMQDVHSWGSFFRVSNKVNMFINSFEVTDYISLYDGQAVFMFDGGRHVLKNIYGRFSHNGNQFGALIALGDGVSALDIDIEGVAVYGKELNSSAIIGAVTVYKNTSNSASRVVIKTIKSRIIQTPGYDLYDLSSAGMLYLFGHDIQTKYISNTTLVKEISPIA